jgi:3-hydroxybutyryl-CoA dehydrogenase
MADINAKGIKNLSGLYHYSREEAARWDEAFASSNADIFQLAALYPSTAVSHFKENNGYL